MCNYWIRESVSVVGVAKIIADTGLLYLVAMVMKESSMIMSVYKS